jgi:hypothetical protein
MGMFSAEDRRRWYGRWKLASVGAAGRRAKGSTEARGAGAKAVALVSKFGTAVSSPDGRRLVIETLMEDIVGSDVLRRPDGTRRKRDELEYRRGREQVMTRLRRYFDDFASPPEQAALRSLLGR